MWFTSDLPLGPQISYLLQNSSGFIWTFMMYSEAIKVMMYFILWVKEDNQALEKRVRGGNAHLLNTYKGK